MRKNLITISITLPGMILVDIGMKPRNSSHYDFVYVVAFGYNKLWWPLAVNNLYVIFQILWALSQQIMEVGGGRKWSVVTSVWPRRGVARWPGDMTWRPNVPTPTSYFISNSNTFLGSSRTCDCFLLSWLIVAGASCQLIMLQNTCMFHLHGISF